MSVASIAILISVATAVSAALIAGIGAVWRLGNRVGMLDARLDAFARVLDSDRSAREMLIARIEAISDYVVEVDGRLKVVEAVCHERRENSARFHVPPSDDGTPAPVGGCR